MPPPPPIPPTWPIPKFTFHVEDVEHRGALLVFEHILAPTALREAVISGTSLPLLLMLWSCVEDRSLRTSIYTSDCSDDVSDQPGYSVFDCTLAVSLSSAEMVTVSFRSMPGVAYTTGSSTHKEIHVSLEHIDKSASRARAEILGVLTHEMVHCFQYNGKDKCPGGLIEGIADYVRLHAGLAPPHWSKKVGENDKWDSGYEKTAYFLDWIEARSGEGTVRALNHALRDKEYTSDIFIDVTGCALEQLWEDYRISQS
ncbi:BSP-domain-containing protein [Punctularia strigosozonata HHB-11173 SS5]|uniref:BSP-domain-containing protein n=1 Tax=Punctularia strigosozonata (strain HHB-11173) TaxID=741275 RepID=UPI00044162F6|nr:BSP-domain-containing protein [Punctularia strigosozonata HHB-11173 SS5]EIN13840.1 BSP-domain-containing protein [Punctularia strigosozonata HHB-11173 SS5]